jgi:hypothetical protein
MLHANQIVVGLLGLGGTMDKQARKERIENMITMAEAFHTFEELPLPERFRKLAGWAETHLSAADQAWIYQQWQHVLERYLVESREEQPPQRKTP